MDLNWNLWVMQFDQAQQEALLRRWFGSGLARWQGPVLLACVALALAMGLLVLQWLQAPSVDRHRRQLDRCLKRLGLAVAPGEPLGHALERLSQSHPELRGAVQELGRSYGRLRFGEGWDAKDQQQWEARIRMLVKRRRGR